LKQIISEKKEGAIVFNNTKGWNTKLTEPQRQQRKKSGSRRLWLSPEQIMVQESAATPDSSSQKTLAQPRSASNIVRSFVNFWK